MAPSSVFHFTIFSALLVSAILISSLVTVTVAGGGNSWIPMKPACTGSLGECMISEEFDMDSESNRRVLATTKYITYDALQKNNAHCSQRGSSYTNCKQGAEAHPYDRGCSSFNGCRK